MPPEPPAPYHDLGQANPNCPRGPLLPIDFELRGENLTVLFTDLGSDALESGVGVFQQRSGRWNLKRFYSEKQIDGGLKFPHSICRTDKGFMISDTLNERVVQLFHNGKADFQRTAGSVNEAMPEKAFGGQGILLGKNGLNGQKVSIQFLSNNGGVVWEFFLKKDAGGNSAPWAAGLLRNNSVGCEIHNAHILPNGNVLVAVSLISGGGAEYLIDKNKKGHIYEIGPDQRIVWQFTREDLRWPRNAIRLKNGHTLIAHSTGIWQVNMQGDVVWDFLSDDKMYNIQRLDDGTTVGVVGSEIIWIPEGCRDMSCVKNRFSFHPLPLKDQENCPPLAPEMLEKIKNHPYLK